MSKTNTNNKKIVCSILIALLATSLVLVTLIFDETDYQANAQPNFLDVSLDGESKLNVNEAGVYTATVTGGSGGYDYTWVVNPTNLTVLEPTGASCSLTFTSATEDPYVLTVQVIDRVTGASGTAMKVVYDPYTSPDVHLAASGAPYSYLIEADGNGWYRAINGTDGSVAFTSTNSETVFNSITALNLPVKINVADGTYIIGQTGTSGSWNFTESNSDSILDLGTATLKVADNCNASAICIQGSDYTHMAKNIKILNGNINGNKANEYEINFVWKGSSGHDFWGNGISLFYASGCTISKVNITNSLMHGIGMYGNAYYNRFENNIITGSGRTGTGMTYSAQGGICFSNDASYNTIINNECYSNLAKGLYLSGSHNNLLVGNTIHNEVVGISLYNGASRNTLDGNRIVTTSTSAIYIVPAGSTVGHNNTLVNNQIKTSSGTWLTVSNYTNTLIANTVWDGAGTLSLTGATGIVFKDNIGFVTENTFSGTNTTATTAVLSHGLVSTPTFYTVNIYDTATSASVTVASVTVTATQITITASGTLPASWTCYVEAIYKP